MVFNLTKTPEEEIRELKERLFFKESYYENSIKTIKIIIYGKAEDKSKVEVLKDLFEKEDFNDFI